MIFTIFGSDKHSLFSILIQSQKSLIVDLDSAFQSSVFLFQHAFSSNLHSARSVCFCFIGFQIQLHFVCFVQCASEPLQSMSFLMNVKVWHGVRHERSCPLLPGSVIGGGCIVSSLALSNQDKYKEDEKRKNQ